MAFQIANKVALVTGGAKGIGLGFVKNLLKNGAKGVTIADMDREQGDKAVEELAKTYGKDKINFVFTDVANTASFENAFQQTISKFENIDLLFNNAGISAEKRWQQVVDVNLKGAINGMILGFEDYLRKHKQGDEAVIVNTSSISAFLPIPHVPVYAATKAGLVALTRTWSHEAHYRRSKIRVLAICPSMTKTGLIKGDHSLNDEYTEIFLKSGLLEDALIQGPDFVTDETMKLISSAPNGSCWIIENGKPAYQYVFPDREKLRD
ncbi:unnamed protein product [Phyllotreta striolata]|uniref:Uncharacterized protein n=1 Tax=Phyllotreta striolata TaxID=444603 RepID=A0A9N9XWT9_PHYSR|nr:unnamed protein product [Phyllotreta striolata]